MHKRNREQPFNPLLVHARFCPITPHIPLPCQCASHSIHKREDPASYHVNFFEDVLQELAFLQQRGSRTTRKALWHRTGCTQDRAGLHCYHSIGVCFPCVGLLVTVHLNELPTMIEPGSSFLLIRDRSTWKAGIIPSFPASIGDTDILATLRQEKLVYTYAPG